MIRPPSRGSTLRVLIGGTATAVVAALSAVVVTPTVAGAAPPDVPLTAWIPGSANRTIVGGAPPNLPPQDVTGQTSSCRIRAWGVLPDYPMERFRISDRLQFGVNLSAGTLWIDHRDLTVRGTGITFNLQHSWGYLDKWHFNAGASMALDLSSSGVVRMPVDGGGCVEFRQNANGTFGPGSNGIRATLTKNTGGSFTARFIDSGETWAFNAHGWPLHRADRNGNAITYYFNSDGTLASVADSQGRVTRFVNSGGRISRITDPSGAVVGDYTYDADGRLIGFTNS